MNGSPQKYLFVTGRLAEPALRGILGSLADDLGFSYEICVLPITVAALMTTDWVNRRLELSERFDLIILPGYCHGPLDELRARFDCEVERGPTDLKRLPEHFGVGTHRSEDYGAYDIEIIAEINHAPEWSIAEVVSYSDQLRTSGADIIDLGSMPNFDWLDVADYVNALRDNGHRVSIDSLMPREIMRAVDAGAELVLSVNSSNREAATDWGCEVVVIPDDPRKLESLDETVDYLADRDVAVRLDPILEPIGCGFAQSLGRYIEIRNRYPDAQMMMGVGNLTELTDADSSGINVILLGFCQELSIHSVLTTQVINWARTSVKECDLARRLVHESIRKGTPPKHVEPKLVTLRDEKLLSLGTDELSRLSEAIRDSNYRLFAENDQLHLLGGGLHLTANDPFELFDQLAATKPKNLDASHAFYLGYELCKAFTALTLSKEYRQDESLNWGYLTVSEKDRHRIKRSRLKDRASNPPNADDNAAD